jgi:hypothetical protein
VHAAAVDGHAEGVVRAPTEEDVRPGLDRFSGEPVTFVTDSLPALRRAQALEPGLLGIVVNAAASADACHDLTEYAYINNPDGTIRWFFESGGRTPLFLALHNAQTRKAAVFHWGTRLLYRAGLKRLVRSGTFLATVPARQVLARYLGREHPFTQAAFFTGTVGEDRKVTVALAGARDRRPRAFLKIPLTESAASLVRNEAAALRALSGTLDGVLDLPDGTVPDAEQLSLLVSNLSTARTHSGVEFTPAHARALRALYRAETRQSPLGEVEAFVEARSRVDAMLRCAPPTNGLDRETFDAVRTALATCAARLERLREARVVTGWAHGDFTPWNSFIGERTLRVYDWEHSRRDVPLLHDLFHYVLQAHVLVTHGEHSGGLAGIAAALALDDVRSVIDEHRVDLNLHLLLYLVYQASLFGPKFATQEPLHAQANWLMSCWRGLLERYVQSDEDLL